MIWLPKTDSRQCESALPDCEGTTFYGNARLTEAEQGVVFSGRLRANEPGIESDMLRSGISGMRRCAINVTESCARPASISGCRCDLCSTAAQTREQRAAKLLS